MNDDTSAPILNAMRLASSELREHALPATLLPAIHRALDSRKAKPARATSRRGAWLGWSSLGTACAVACVMLVVNAPESGESNPSVAERSFVAVGSDASRAGAAWLVPTEMSQARLVGLGLPYDPARAGERMPAQVLVQDGGDVLAVRVMQ